MINKKNLGGLNKRMAQSANGSNGNGGSNFSVMDWSKSGKDKDELKFFKPVEGKNVIDIIPYDIKTKNHPMVRSGEAEIGDADYVLEVWQHSNIGPSKKTILCLNRMYGKPCPICEAANAMRKNGKEEQAKKLYAKQRAFYNVVDANEPETVKVFDVSYKLFEKELIEEAKDDEDGFANFADPTENGYSVKFKATKENGGDFTFLKFKSFAFLDREEELTDEVLAQAISFDELLKIPTYDEVLSAFNGEDAEDEDNEEQPVKSSKKHIEEDDDDEDDEPKAKPRHNREEDEDDEEEQPKVKKHSNKSFGDMDEVPSKKSCKGKCKECPFGHKFGEDNDNYEDCDDCESWQSCADAQEGND